MVAALFACLLSTSAFAPAPELALYVEQQATAHHVPLKLAESVMWQESRWNPFAVRYNSSGSVDRGMWQLNSRSLPWFARHFNGGRPINPYDPYISTHVAIQYLRYLHDLTGSWTNATMSYNAGPWAVINGKIPREAVWYVEQITARASM